MGKSIFDLSWNEDGFFAKLHLIIKSESETKKAWQLRVNKSCVNRGGGIAQWKNKQRDVLSALSSAYYSVAGSCFSWVRRPPVFLSKKNPLVVLEIIFRVFQIPFWLLLGAYCFIRMLPTSDKMLSIAGGYENLTADQCDIRQSILRRYRNWEEALECIEYGARKNPSLHCEALLLVGKSYCRMNLGYLTWKDDVVGYLDRMLEISIQTIKDNPHQTSRILRHCADLGRMVSNNESDLCRLRAEQLAQQVGAKDQLLKI
jgi:hypothetical protein